MTLTFTSTEILVHSGKSIQAVKNISSNLSLAMQQRRNNNLHVNLILIGIQRDTSELYLSSHQLFPAEFIWKFLIKKLFPWEFR